MDAEENWNPETSGVVRCWREYRSKIYQDKDMLPDHEKEVRAAFASGMLMTIELVNTFRAITSNKPFGEEVRAQLMESLRADICAAIEKNGR